MPRASGVLTHQGKPRQEIDLVPPEPPETDGAARRIDRNAMPPAVCPDGSPPAISDVDSQCEGRPEPTGLPGTSILDELTKIRQENAPQPPGQTGGEA